MGSLSPATPQMPRSAESVALDLLISYSQSLKYSLTTDPTTQNPIGLRMFEFIKMNFGRRRIAFLFHYLLARARAKSINNGLLPIIEKSFDHPWITRVELKVRFSPGRETTLNRLWRLFKSLPMDDNLMHWDAPVTVSIFRKRRGKERQALCMSLYIRSGILYIGQLQGVAGTDIPEGLRHWPKMFIEACKRFACQQELREVRVPRASTLASFRNPYGRSEMLTEGRIKSVPRIRRNMELLYDKNALDVGLVPDGDWFKWQNARLIRGRPTILQRATAAAVSLGLVGAATAILFQVHARQTEHHRLVYFYLLPLVLIAALYNRQVAILYAGVALLCADYFLQDPVFSFRTSEYYDLVWFAALATIAIKVTRSVFPISGGDTASPR